ncbi:MAG: hypothetical protein H7A24_14300 [Leptospiraceae bacterium]|nr:hypothetical protein [Leptospiraceae bacterium]MCP5513053.1 hypothetical protein [Leptospiraceae bacterium]
MQFLKSLIFLFGFNFLFVFSILNSQEKFPILLQNSDSLLFWEVVNDFPLNFREWIFAPQMSSLPDILIAILTTGVRNPNLYLYFHSVFMLSLFFGSLILLNGKDHSQPFRIKKILLSFLFPFLFYFLILDQYFLENQLMLNSISPGHHMGAYVNSLILFCLYRSEFKGKHYLLVFHSILSLASSSFFFFWGIFPVFVVDLFSQWKNLKLKDWLLRILVLLFVFYSSYRIPKDLNILRSSYLLTERILFSGIQLPSDLTQILDGSTLFMISILLLIFLGLVFKKWIRIVSPTEKAEVSEHSQKIDGTLVLYFIVQFVLSSLLILFSKIFFNLNSVRYEFGVYFSFLILLVILIPKKLNYLSLGFLPIFIFFNFKNSFKDFMYYTPKSLSCIQEFVPYYSGLVLSDYWTSRELFVYSQFSLETIPLTEKGDQMIWLGKHSKALKLEKENPEVLVFEKKDLKFSVGDWGKPIQKMDCDKYVLVQLDPDQKQFKLKKDKILKDYKLWRKALGL